MFALAVVYIKDILALQLLLVILPSLGMLMYVNIVKPFNEEFFNFIEIYNEMTILISSYFTMLFTSFTNIEQRSTLGWYFVTFVAINIVINLGAILFKFGYTIYLAIMNFIRKRRMVKKEP